MAITTVLFDLDGTLLPMDQEVFTKAYFQGLTAKALPYGYEPKQLMQTIWAGTAAMTKNDGGQFNQQLFWDTFFKQYGEGAKKDIPLFDDFYRNEFQQIQACCGFSPLSAKWVHTLKEKGLCIALATSPIFPRIATESRIRWAGLSPEDFAWITTYENSRSCKPNPQYYRDLCETLGVCPEECLMVGNDMEEDMIAASVDMQVFLLTDCLINKAGRSLQSYPHGDSEAFTRFIDETDFDV